MNYWHLAAAISVWLMAVGLGVLGVGMWKAEGFLVGEPSRSDGPICCIFLLVIAGLYAWGGFIFLNPGAQ